MIRSFANNETEKIFRGEVSKKLPPDIQRTARRKLIYLNEADNLRDLILPKGNRLEALKGTARDNTVFESTINGAFASDGSSLMHTV